MTDFPERLWPKDPDVRVRLFRLRADARKARAEGNHIAEVEARGAFEALIVDAKTREANPSTTVFVV